MVGLVTDAAVFDPSYVPAVLPERRPQVEVLAHAVAPLGTDDEGREIAPAPTILSGPPGTGKTVTARYVLGRLATRDGLAVAHVDCARTDGRFDVLQQLLRGADLRTVDLHAGSTPHAVVMDRLHDGLDGPYVVVLDHVDRLADRDLLYPLNRIPELALVLASNSTADLFASLDPRLQSRLRAGVRIGFEPYDPAVLVDILRVRVDRGFRPGAVDGETLREIADAVGGNAGRAVRTLRMAAAHADEASAAAIGSAAVEGALARTGSTAPHRPVSDLPADHRLLYEVVHEAGRLAPEAIYERYRDAVAEPKTRRTVRSYLAELVDDGLLRTEGETKRRRYVPAGGTP